MFEALFDEFSRLWSWRWPVADGQITTVELERVDGENETWRLAIVYEFSIGDDGPYTGECFWSPMFSINAAHKLRDARRTLLARKNLLVRYRPDDPSVNTLAGSVADLLK